MRIEDEVKKKDLKNRIARACGQLQGISKMIEDGEDCTKIAEQLSAAKSALSQVLATFAVCAFEEAEHPYAAGKKSSIAKIVKIIS